MPHLFTCGQIQFGRAFPTRWFAEGRLPRKTPPVGMNVKDSKTGFAPAGSAVFDYGDSRAEASDKASNYEVTGIGAACRWFLLWV
jgi:hypothetical protein